MVSLQNNADFVGTAFMLSVAIFHKQLVDLLSVEL
jgi:hypothetical protein